MAGNDDDLIIGVSTDTSTISRALNKLVSDVGVSAAQIQSRFESVGKGVDKSMTTALQSQINGMVGVGVAATKEWSGALSDQGKQLDALRAKINPVFSTISNYKAAIAEIKTANALGAVSADEMASAISRERLAALSSIAAIKARNAAIAGGGVVGVATGGHGSAGGLGQTQMMALQHSVRSITEQLALGISPMQAFMGQLSHLSYVASGPGGAMGALKAIGDSALGIVTKFPLATAAIAAAGAAFLAYKLMAAKELPTVDEVLKRHGDYIKELKDYYDGAKASAEKYGTTASIVLNAITSKQTDEAKKVATNSNREFFGKFQLSELITGSDKFVVDKKFKAAEEAILKFREELSKGRGDFDKFNEDIEKSTLSRKLKNEAIAAAQDIRELNAAANTQPISEYQKSIAELNTLINSIKSDEAKKQLQTLVEKFTSGKISVADLIHEIDLLSGKSIDVSSITDDLKKIVKGAEDAKNAIGTIYGMPSNTVGDIAAGLRGPNVAGITSGRVGKPNAKEQSEAMDHTQGVFKDALNLYQRNENELREALKRKNKELNHVDKPKVDKDANAERDNLKRGQDRIDRMNEEIKTIGLNGAAQDTLRFKLDLLQKATDKGRKLTPEYRAEIDKLTEAYGKAAEKVAFLKAQQDLTFEREQMFRSPTEQRVYSSLKSSGLDPKSEAGQMLASQIRLNEALATGRDLALDFASGFLSDLRNGVKATEALGNALGRLGDKLIDMALNQAINSLFANLTGAIGGGGGSPGGGGIIGGIGKILGFADGGYTGHGGIGDVAGVVHGKEFVVNAQATARNRGLLEAINRGVPGYKDGGFVSTPIPVMTPIRGPNMPNLSYGGGGGSINAPVAISIDARGADNEGLARVQGQLNQLRAELPAHIVTTVRKAQKSRILS